MVEVLDSDIAEALHLGGYSNAPHRILQVRDDPLSWRETLAHAQTIAKLQVAMKALGRLSALTPRAANAGYADELHASVKAIADSAIAQIKGPTS